MGSRTKWLGMGCQLSIKPGQACSQESQCGEEGRGAAAPARDRAGWKGGLESVHHGGIEARVPAHGGAPRRCFKARYVDVGSTQVHAHVRQAATPALLLPRCWPAAPGGARAPRSRSAAAAAAPATRARKRAGGLRRGWPASPPDQSYSAAQPAEPALLLARLLAVSALPLPPLQDRRWQDATRGSGGGVPASAARCSWPQARLGRGAAVSACRGDGSSGG